MGRLARHLTFANAMSVVAMFIALGGLSYAALQLPKNSVGARQLKKSAVTSAKVANGTLEAVDFKKGTLLGGPIGPVGPQGAPGTPGTPESGGGEAPPPMAVSVTHNIMVAFTHNATSAMPFNTELFDTAEMHDPGSSRLKAPVDGIYEVSATITFAANVAGIRELNINFNGLGINPIAATSTPGSAGGPRLSAAGLVQLKAGDYVEASPYQNSGGTLNVFGTGNLAGPRFSMHLVAP